VLLDNKVVIVTGASRGIGRAIAVACAKEGAHVVLNYWGDNDRSYGRLSAVEEVVDEIETLGRRVIAVEGNVAQRKTGLELVKQAVDAFGHVDVLASNAGICPFHTFLDMPASVYEATVGVNLNGAFLGIKEALDVMRQTASGSPSDGAIINIASVSALKGSPGMPAYSAGKGGLRLFTKAIAVDFARRGYRIRVNSIYPGLIDTPLTKPLFESRLKPGSEESLEDARSRILEQYPIGRIGRPDEIASVVRFLAGDDSSYMVGAELVVDGGLTAA